MVNLISTTTTELLRQPAIALGLFYCTVLAFGLLCIVTLVPDANQSPAHVLHLTHTLVRMNDIRKNLNVSFLEFVSLSASQHQDPFDRYLTLSV